MSARFYFSTCQIGAEKAVKAEITSEFKHLKFAFMRPGFITFKEDDDQNTAITKTKSIFTRLWGQAFGQAKSPEALIELIEALPDQALIHTFERDTFVPGDDPLNFIRDAHINGAVNALPAKLKSNFRWNEAPKQGETVFDLIWIDDFHLFLGTHQHGFHLDPSPGNDPRIALHPDSPSRAYLKLVEAIQRFHPHVEIGMRVLEIGCSPGGATTAMLNLGMKVVGVDPKQMDARLYARDGFRYIQKMAAEVNASDLKDVNPDWIVLDMNIAPLEAIDELTHVITVLRKNHGAALKIKHGFLTIKLNDWQFADKIPLYLKRLAECGFKNMTAMQMSSNRQEFFVFAGNFT